MTDADRVLLSLIGLGVVDVLVPRHAHQPSPGGALEAHRCQEQQSNEGHPRPYQKLIREDLAPFLCGIGIGSNVINPVNKLGKLGDEDSEV